MAEAVLPFQNGMKIIKQLVTENYFIINCTALSAFLFFAHGTWLFLMTDVISAHVCDATNVEKCSVARFIKMY